MKFGLKKKKPGDEISPGAISGNEYSYTVCIANRRAWIRHLKRLVKKHGAKNVPLDEAFRFKIKWKCKRKSLDKNS